MAYHSMEFVDLPQEISPINAENLNNMIAGIDEAKADVAGKENSDNKVLTYNTMIPVELNVTKFPSMRTLAALMMVYFPQKTIFVFRENASTGSYTYSFSADDNTTVFNQTIVNSFLAMQTSTKKLVSVYIGSQVAAISAGAFLQASYLENMYVNNSPEKIGIADGVFSSDDFPVYYLRVSKDLYKRINNKLDNADYSVEKNNLSEELQELLDYLEQNADNCCLMLDDGEITSLNQPVYAQSRVKHLFIATGNLATQLGVDEYTICEMVYDSPYQIVTVAATQQKFTREVYQVAPYFRASDWNVIAPSYTKAETDTLLEEKLSTKVIAVQPASAENLRNLQNTNTVYQLIVAGGVLPSYSSNHYALAYKRDDTSVVVMTKDGRFFSSVYSNSEWSDFAECISPDVAEMLDVFNSTDFIAYYDVGTLSASSALNSPNYVGFGKYAFKATGNLAEIFGGESADILTCEMSYNSPYQIVTVVDSHKTFIREVYQIAPNWRSGEWIEKSSSGGSVDAYTKAETNALLDNKLNNSSGVITATHLSGILDTQTIGSNQSRIPSSYAVSSALANKAHIESGTIANDNYAWYAGDTSKRLTGTYQLIGDYCILSGTAHRINGWSKVYYSLPVAANKNAAAVSVSDVNYTINTTVQSNISVLEINRADRGNMTNSDTIDFVLMYKYR